MSDDDAVQFSITGLRWKLVQRVKIEPVANGGAPVYNKGVRKILRTVRTLQYRDVDGEWRDVPEVYIDV
jgi:phage-related protein